MCKCIDLFYVLFGRIDNLLGLRDDVHSYQVHIRHHNHFQRMYTRPSLRDICTVTRSNLPCRKRLNKTTFDPRMKVLVLDLFFARLTMLATISIALIDVG